MIRSNLKVNSIKKALTGAIVFCLAQTASAFDVAPYFQAWSGDLTAAKQAAGLNSAILSFAVTDGGCALEPYLLERLPDARRYIASGGRLMVSFGGAAGTYAEIACSDDQLFTLMEKLMVDSGTRRFDWDVEGHQLLNKDATARRARVLARLQAKYPDLYTSFTLPAWLNGFETVSIDLLKTTIAAGVRIDMVNAMSMTFGAENVRTMVSPSTMGQAVIMAIRASAAQVAKLYPSKSAVQVNAMMGVTPMIGTNDDRTVFTLDDARAVANYVKQNGIGMIGYWSFQRDRFQASGGATSINSASGVAQSAYQFYEIFKTGGIVSGAAPAPAPAPATAFNPAPAPAPVTTETSCSSTAWVNQKYYAAGSVVSYEGKLYRAKYANPGYTPTISTYYWATYLCGGTAEVAPAPEPTATAGWCSSTAWSRTQYYPAGSVVTYNGLRYVAKYANPGYTPTVSTYYWARSTC